MHKACIQQFQKIEFCVHNVTEYFSSTSFGSVGMVSRPPGGCVSSSPKEARWLGFRAMDNL